jgi:hypothetical protein
MYVSYFSSCSHNLNVNVNCNKIHSTHKFSTFKGERCRKKNEPNINLEIMLKTHTFKFFKSIVFVHKCLSYLLYSNFYH